MSCSPSPCSKVVAMRTWINGGVQPAPPLPGACRVVSMGQPMKGQRRSPSYVGLRPASEAASRAKRANRKKDTAHELLLHRELWRLGLRYRMHVAGLPGSPDLVFRRARVVVFCDGDFWHGRHWKKLRADLQRRHNAAYWIAKIARNRERDQ